MVGLLELDVHVLDLHVNLVDLEKVVFVRLVSQICSRDGNTTKTKTRSKPATRLDPGHKLRTTDSETEIVQRLKSVAVGMDFFCGFFVDCGMKMKQI